MRTRLEDYFSRIFFQIQVSGVRCQVSVKE